MHTGRQKLVLPQLQANLQGGGQQTHLLPQCTAQARTIMRSTLIATTLCANTGQTNAINMSWWWQQCTAVLTSKPQNQACQPNRLDRLAMFPCK